MPVLHRSKAWLRLVLVLTLVSTLAGAVRAQESLVEGTMPEDFLPGLRSILSIAVSRSPVALQGQIDMAIAEANRYGAYAVYWPSMGGGANYGRSSASTSGQTGSSTSSGFGYSVGVNRDLFEWGADKAQVDIAKLNSKMAQRNFAEAYRTLAVTIRSQYLGLIVKKVSLRNTQFLLDLQKRNLDAVAEKAKNGMISKDSVEPLQLDYKEALLNAEKMKTDYNFARLVFARLAGLDSFSDEEVPSTISRPVFHPDLADALLQQFIGGGVHSTFADDVFKIDIDIQKLNYRVTKYTLFPKAGIGASYGVSTSNTVINGDATVSRVASSFVGLNIGWTIFDGFRTHYAKQSSSYETKAVDDATNMKELCGFADRAVDIAVVRRGLGENGVRQLTEQVKLGSVSQDTLNSQTQNFNQADYVATVSVSDFFNRWTDFVSLVGQDPALKNLPSAYVR